MSAADWSELDGYEALVSELRANPPVAPERLRQRVLETPPAARAPSSRKRKLVLAFVVTGIVAAVGPALVHGFISSGSNGPVAARANPHLSPLEAQKLAGSTSSNGSGGAGGAPPKQT